MCRENLQSLDAPCAHEPLLGRAALLRSPNIEVEGYPSPTGLLERSIGRSLSNCCTLCDAEPRIADFIPLQLQHVQEHRNNSNAFANTTLKRHECRAPLARFMGSTLSKNNHTLCGHEPILGRAALLRSPNRKAARQRRPTFRFMRKINTKLMCLALAFATPLTSIGQEHPPQQTEPPPAIQPASHYRSQTWTTDDGLPQNTVVALAQTPDGYLWIGTRFGLARFDGVRFVTFNEKNTAAFKSHTINSLYVDSEGVLWIATQNGLLQLKNRVFKRIGMTEGLPHENVIFVTGSENGDVWILSHPEGKTISRIRNDQVDHFDAEAANAASANSVFEDWQSRIWTVNQWIVKTLNPKTREFAIPEISTRGGLYAYSITQSEDGTLWFGQEGGIYVYSENTSHFIPFPQNLADEIAEHLSLDSQSALWISTKKGPLRFFNGSWSFYPIPEDHQPSNLSAVMEDRDGNYWYGSRAGGLHRIRLGKLRAYAKEQGLADDSAWSVCEGRDGGLWIGTSGGLSRLFQGELTSFKYRDGVPRGLITTVCETRAGDLFFGMRDGGSPGFDGTAFLCRYREGNFTPLYPEPFGDLNRVWATYEDSRGSLWIGTRQGLFRGHNGDYQKYSTNEGLSHKDVRAIVEDRNGGLWIGTNGGGLNYFQDGRFTSYSVEDGLSNVNAWSIHIDSEATVWVGTEYGLNRFKDGSFTQYFQEHGLFDDLVNHILEDDFGNLWISCNRGIYRVSKRELNDFAEGKLEGIRHVAYGTADGMLSSETNGENQPAGCKTRDGKLVFPTSKGIVVIDPVEVLGENLLPPVIIEEVSANGKMIVSNEPGHSPQSVAWEGDRDNSVLKLSPGSGNVLQFQYTANSLTESSKALFKYRLHGHHDDWIDAGRRRMALYTNLRPGSYRFQVIAANHNGVWNETGADFSFSIAPHFYQTNLFYALIAIGVITFAGVIHRFVLIQRMKLARLQHEVALNKERSRIAQDMHDEMGGTLTEISLLGELASQLESPSSGPTPPIERIKRRSRELVQSMDGIVWATNPKHDTLESLVAYLSQFAQNFLNVGGLRCNLETPLPGELPDRELTSEIRHNLFLIFKESLTNIVKHSGATEVTVRCSLERGKFLLAVEDNGKGFSSSNMDPNSFGNGVTNMKQRIQRIQGELQIGENAPSGTVVKVSIQMREN